MKIKLTDELIAEIKEARELKMSYAEIGQMFNIGKSTIYRALKKIQEEEARSDNKNEDADTIMVSTILTTTETVVAENVNVGTAEDFDVGLNLYPIGNGLHIKCGLVKERHEMPCQLYVFDEALSEQLMFDYKAQLTTCEHFIDSNIKFNKDGSACQDIVCYVTGIQCALAAFIKACHNKKVNLILRHYNSRFTKYAYQSIWSEFGEPYPDYVASLIGQSLAAYTYGHRLSEIDTSHLYTVCVVTYDANNAPITVIYICSTLADAYRVNYTIVEDLMYKHNGSYQIYLEERTLNSKESGYTSEKILKTCNN